MARLLRDSCDSGLACLQHAPTPPVVTLVQTVEVWPSYAALYAHEAAVGWPQVQPQAGQQPHLLDSIPGGWLTGWALGSPRAHTPAQLHDGTAQLRTTVSRGRVRGLVHALHEAFPSALRGGLHSPLPGMRVGCCV